MAGTKRLLLSRRRAVVLILLLAVGVAGLVVSDQSGFAPADAVFGHCRRWPGSEVTARQLFGQVFLLPPPGKIIDAGMKGDASPRYFWLEMQCDISQWHEILKRMNSLSPATMGPGTTVESRFPSDFNVVDVRPLWWPNGGAKVLDCYHVRTGSDAASDLDRFPHDFLIGFSGAENRLYVTFTD